MSLNQTPMSERVHISFFGLRNAGKSSIVNAITGQQVSVVSDVKGTTTDPVRKTMELLPLGPVVIIDTPGLDDVGELGKKRIQKANEILAQTDIAVLVVDALRGISDQDRKIIGAFQQRNLPYLIVLNKSDLKKEKENLPDNSIYASALRGEGITEIKELLGAFTALRSTRKCIVSDLLSRGDHVILVVPIDESAPKGRLILPQQQTIRDILDAHCTLSVCQPEELSNVLDSMKESPKLVITDSQVFSQVAKIVPENVLLTSFSILFARYKGNLKSLVLSAAQLSKLKAGDRILISEGCTHHRQCNDIGSVKFPGWIEAYTGVVPEYSFSSGGGFPEDLSAFSLIIHCGGCMLNEAEMKYRMEKAAYAKIPMLNYGVAIAQMHRILYRALSPFPEIQSLLT